jgi:hypothetical protein
MTMFSSFWMANPGGGGYSVDNSIVLDDGSSQYLTGSTLSGGSERIGTYSFWTKRANLGTQQEIYTQYRTSTNNFAFRIKFLSGDTLDITCENDSGIVLLRRTTTQVFRDPHAFLHVHVQINGNKTDDTCCTLTINGSVVSDFSTKTNLSSGTDLNLFTSSKSAFIGSTPAPAGYYDGYFSEFVAIDGGNAAATSFGEYDLNGVWRPIDVTQVATDRDQIPALTSNSAPSPYAVTASSEDGAGSEGYRMFANGSSSWRTASGAGGVANIVIDVGSANAFAATSLVLTGTGDAATRCPTNFTFEGSNTGSFSGEETVLYTGSSLSWSASETKTFTFSNTTSFRYYKLDVTSTSGGTYVEIEEGEIRKEVTGDFGTNGFYLPFSAGSGANLGANSVPASTFTPAAANYTYNATYLTIGSGTINNNGSPGVSGRLNNPFNGDFTFSFTATAIAGSIFGVFDATELSTFSTGTDDGGLDSMTNSWWYDDGGNGTGGGGTVGNGYFMYGNSSQGTGPIAAGSAVTIERTGSIIKITDDSSDAHSFSQTFSGPVYIMVGHRNIASKSMDYDSVSMNGKQAFAVNGSPTQSSDTPTNNSATLTTIDGSGATFSNGNLVVGSNTTNSYKGGTGCIGLAPGSGSWYVEALCTGATGANKEYVFGAATNDTNKSVAGYFPGSATYSNDDEHGYYSGSGGIVYNGSSSTGSVGIYGDGNTVALRFDMDVTTPTCKFYVNDTLKHTANLTVGKTYYPHFNTQDSNLTFTVNFGATSFTYTLPTGHLAINTTNLYTNAAPAIEDGTAHFQATTYTGTGSARDVIQSENTTFQPDWVWVKRRNALDEHRLIDAVRLATETIYLGGALGSAAEATESTGVTSFNSDPPGFGFSVGTGGGYNNLDDTYVGWQWKGDGTSGSSNTDGSITSTVNVNDTAGFSIVKYTSTNGSGAGTVGHGQTGALDLILVKNLDSTDNWAVYHSGNTSAPETDYLILNLANATADSNTFWNDTAPSSISPFVFSVGTSGAVNDQGAATNHIAYCFRAIPGYSAFGSFEGNGGPDGPLIQLDFKPAYIMFKNTNATGSWAIFDIFRSLFNPVDDTLIANGKDVEVSGSDDFDFLANGVKIRSTWAQPLDRRLKCMY